MAIRRRPALAGVFFAAASAASAPWPATQLKTEYLTAPLLDVPVPRFYWIPYHDDRAQSQTAYRIQVNATDSVGSFSRVVWDSGKVRRSGPPVGCSLQLPVPCAFSLA